MSVRRLSKTFISGAGAAAEKSSNFLAGYSPAIDEMDLIERITVGAGGTSAIEFDQIPQTYQHLQIRYLMRCAANGTGILLQFNTNTSSNYAVHRLNGDGSGVSAAGGASATATTIGVLSPSTTSANVFGAAVIDILDYASSSKATTLRALTGWDNNGSGQIHLRSGLWTLTNPVSSIKIYNDVGNLSQYSTASLYGVKA